jgi:ribosomal protein S18
MKNFLLKAFVTFFIPICLAQGDNNAETLRNEIHESSIVKLQKNHQKQLNRVNSRINQVIERINQVNQQNRLLKYSRDSLNREVSHLKNEISKNKKGLNDEKIHTAYTFKSYFYVVLGILIFLLGLVLGYLLIRHKTKTLSVKTNVLDENTSALKTQVNELMQKNTENLLTIIEEFKKSRETMLTNQEPDHTLALEFVKQIVTMENNMFHMNPEDPGLRRIRRALDKMYDALSALDYKSPQLLGNFLSEGQTIEIDRREFDETMEKGTNKVISIQKAEVFYKEELIQRGKVDVKYNPI